MIKTQEQLEAMSDVDLSNAVTKAMGLWKVEGQWDWLPGTSHWLTGDGMLALMEWLKGQRMRPCIEAMPCRSGFVYYADISRFVDDDWSVVESCMHASAPRALAIAVVLAVQDAQSAGKDVGCGKCGHLPCSTRKEVLVDDLVASYAMERKLAKAIIAGSPIRHWSEFMAHSEAYWVEVVGRQRGITAKWAKPRIQSALARRTAPNVPQSRA